MPSSPPPDKFQREIDDIIRLAERRLEHQSFRYRVRRSTRRLGSAFGGFALKLPPAETLGGWGLALLLISWLLSLISLSLVQPLRPWVLGFGILFLTLALISSLLRGRGATGIGSGGGGGGGGKMWRGERIAYGSPYGESWLSRLRRMFRGR
jgi:hypothetical protein